MYTNLVERIESVLFISQSVNLNVHESRSDSLIENALLSYRDSFIKCYGLSKSTINDL